MYFTSGGARAFEQLMPVSYTHLDVYKRQHWDRPQRFLLRLRQGKPADLHPWHTAAPTACAGVLAR